MADDMCTSEVAYKMPRIVEFKSVFLALQCFFSTVNGSTNPGSDRQHDGGILFQPSGKYSFMLFGRTETFCLFEQ